MSSFSSFSEIPFSKVPPTVNWWVYALLALSWSGSSYFSFSSVSSSSLWLRGLTVICFTGMLAFLCLSHFVMTKNSILSYRLAIVMKNLNGNETSGVNSWLFNKEEKGWPILEILSECSPEDLKKYQKWLSRQLSGEIEKVTSECRVSQNTRFEAANLSSHILGLPSYKDYLKPKNGASC